MVPVQTLTTDEPDDALERDLIVRAGNPSSTSDTAGSGSPGNQADHEANEGYTGSPGSPADHEANEANTNSSADAGGAAAPGAARGFAHLHPWAFTDDFGQPVPDPNPMREPTWQQIAAMGYEIPGIGVVGGDVVAAILAKFDTRIARVLLDERTGVVIETSTKEYLPDKAIRRFIQNRDGHCRFPPAPATPDAANPTTSSPTPAAGPPPHGIWQACVKHHHRVKHEAGWSLTMTREGICTVIQRPTPTAASTSPTPSTTTSSPPDPCVNATA